MDSPERSCLEGWLYLNKHSTADSTVTDAEKERLLDEAERCFGRSHQHSKHTYKGGRHPDAVIGEAEVLARKGQLSKVCRFCPLASLNVCELSPALNIGNSSVCKIPQAANLLQVFHSAEPWFRGVQMQRTLLFLSCQQWAAALEATESLSNSDSELRIPSILLQSLVVVCSGERSKVSCSPTVGLFQLKATTESSVSKQRYAQQRQNAVNLGCWRLQ